MNFEHDCRASFWAHAILALHQTNASHYIHKYHKFQNRFCHLSFELCHLALPGCRGLGFGGYKPYFVKAKLNAAPSPAMEEIQTLENLGLLAESLESLRARA